MCQGEEAAWSDISESCLFQAGSKYCSDQCGLSLATLRIYQVGSQSTQKTLITRHYGGYICNVSFPLDPA